MFNSNSYNENTKKIQKLNTPNNNRFDLYEQFKMILKNQKKYNADLIYNKAGFKIPEKSSLIINQSSKQNKPEISPLDAVTDVETTPSKISITPF